LTNVIRVAKRSVCQSNY